MKSKLLTFFCFFSLVTCGAADLVGNLNSWLIYSGNHVLSEKISIHSVVNIRKSIKLNQSQAELYRLGINFHQNTKTILSGGVDYIKSYSSRISLLSKENLTRGIWETLQFKEQLGCIELVHRYRLEQLWSKESGSSENSYRNKLRYMILGKVSLNNSLKVVGFNELFLQFGHDSFGKVFDQNRAGLLIAYKIRKMEVQLGYLNQFISGNESHHFINNNTLVLGIDYSI